MVVAIGATPIITAALLPKGFPEAIHSAVKTAATQRLHSLNLPSPALIYSYRPKRARQKARAAGGIKLLTLDRMPEQKRPALTRAETAEHVRRQSR